MKVTIKGLTTNYEISGEGKEILMLHGWGARIESFKPLVDYFSQFFKVVTLDFPGFGKTSTPKEVWGIEDYSDFTAEFIGKLGIKNPILLGHSFGGRVIIHMLGNNKIEAEKVILVDSAGIKPRRNLYYYLKVYSFKLVKNVLLFPLWSKKTQDLLNKARDFFGSKDYKNSDGILRSIMVKVVNEDLKRFLPHIDVPTLLIWGEMDQATPLRDGKLMEKKIPDAGLVVLAGAGHFSYLDRPNEFIVIVHHFLKPESRQ
jgi:pimeloyl-ACP methyl ester carboxylesterase